MKNGMKQTEIGEIPVEWDVYSFSEFFQVISGKKNQLTSLEYQAHGTYPIIDQGQKPIVGYTDREDKVFSNKSGVIVFGDHTRIIKFINFDFVVGADGTQLLSSKNGVLLKFAYYQLAFKEIVSLGYSRHFKLVKEMLFAVPTLPEQRKIAEILSTLDEKMAVIDEQLAQTQELKKGLMQRLLTKGIGHTQFKDSPLGEIPASWEAIRVGKVAKLQGGFAFKSTDAQDNGVRWLKIANVSVGEIDWTAPSFLPFGFDAIYRSFLLKKGDIVIAMTRPILGDRLKIAVINDDSEPVLLNQRVGRIMPSDKVADGFVYHVCNTAFFIDSMKKELIGSDPPNISSAMFENMLIPLPPLPEQRQIAEILTTVDEKIGVLQDKKAQVHTLKKGLMQQLLTGQRRVRVATPAMAELV